MSSTLGDHGDFYSNLCIFMYFTNFLQDIYHIHIHKIPLNTLKHLKDLTNDI